MTFNKTQRVFLSSLHPCFLWLWNVQISYVPCCQRQHNLGRQDWAWFPDQSHPVKAELPHNWLHLAVKMYPQICCSSQGALCTEATPFQLQVCSVCLSHLGIQPHSWLLGKLSHNCHNCRIREFLPDSSWDFYGSSNTVRRGQWASGS